MNRIYIYLSLLLMGCGFISCSSDNNNESPFSSEHVGAISFQGIELNEEIPWIITKAADFSMLDPMQFIVEIYKKGETEPYKRFETFKKLEEVGTPLELPIGDYTVKVFPYDLAPVLRDTPYFLGESDFTIESHEVTKVEVECSYQSLGIEFQLTNAFLNFFADDYKITVYQDHGVSAVYTQEESGIIYFTEDCLYLKVVVECKTKGGVEYPALTYYLNEKGEDPEFGEDGPHRGEYFIITVDSDKISGKSMTAH